MSLSFASHFTTLSHTVHARQSYLGEEEEAQEQMERWQAEQTFSPFVSRYALECFGRIRMVANARDATQVWRCGRCGQCVQSGQLHTVVDGWEAWEDYVNTRDVTHVWMCERCGQGEVQAQRSGCMTDKSHQRAPTKQRWPKCGDGSHRRSHPASCLWLLLLPCP